MATLFNTSWLTAGQLIDGDKFEALNSPEDKITYLKTDALLEILKYKCFETNPKEVCPKEHVLITHNSDYYISPKTLKFAETLGLPLHWFAQNVLVQHPKITPIPIGLERVRWFPHMRKRDILLEYMSKIDTTPTELCLANFSLSTTYFQRKACLDFSCTFSTIDVDNSVIQHPYTDFIESVKKHYFVLCPEGNGIDTHRLWETLYLGRIPIVTNNITVESFKDLPILIIPSWNYLTQDILINFLKNFQADRINYSLEKMNFQYWEKLIRKEIHAKF